MGIIIELGGWQSDGYLFGHFGRATQLLTPDLEGRSHLVRIHLQLVNLWRWSWYAVYQIGGEILQFPYVGWDCDWAPLGVQQCCNNCNFLSLQNMLNSQTISTQVQMWKPNGDNRYQPSVFIRSRRKPAYQRQQPQYPSRVSCFMVGRKPSKPSPEPAWWGLGDESSSTNVATTVHNSRRHHMTGQSTVNLQHPC